MSIRPAAALFAALALASAVTPAIGQQPERYKIIRPQVQLWSAPGDDMRPQIVGTVTANAGAVVTLAGGAVVPAAAAAKPGDLATFACKFIGDGDPPEARDCELLRAQPPAKAPKAGGVELW